MPHAVAFMIAAGASVTATSLANAQPPGTLCGHTQNSLGASLPVIVLNGNPECSDAVNVAQSYLTGPHPADGGTLQLETIGAWKCYAPAVPGRSHADSYLECDGPGGGVKIGN